MTEEKKAPKEKWTMDVTDKVRIVEHDTYNFTIQRKEPTNKADGSVVDEYKDKGFYGTVKGAVEGILDKDILVDLKAVASLRDYRKQVLEHHKLIIDLLEGIE